MENTNICSICFEIIDNKNLNYKILECKHKFHTTCIKKWFLENHKKLFDDIYLNGKCPLCRNLSEEYFIEDFDNFQLNKYSLFKIIFLRIIGHMFK